MRTGADERAVWGWALYDWANSAFATTVMAGFFPVFFKEFWNAGVPAVESTFRLGMFNSVASLLVVLLAPVLGAIADHLSRRKAFVFIFSTLGIVATGSLYLIEQGHWLLAALCYLCAALGFSSANLFYDSLLVFVAEPRKLDRVSALGFSLGYLGGGVLFGLNVWMTQQPALFGLADMSEAVRVSFVCVAAWWALFSIPLYLWVPEPHPQVRTRGFVQSLRGGLGRLAHTLHEVRSLRITLLFLVAYWFYIDGVDTILRMAVDYGLSLGFPSSGLILALLITQFVGFPATLIFGRLGERWGPKRGVLLAIAVYLVVTVLGSMMYATWHFYLLAAAIGLVQGGIQALSRSLYARLIPAGRSSEFFGFYNMLGKFAAVLGPMLMGWTALLTDSTRMGILSISLLLLLGGGLLLLVDVEEGARRARAQ